MCKHDFIYKIIVLNLEIFQSFYMYIYVCIYNEKRDILKTKTEVVNLMKRPNLHLYTTSHSWCKSEKIVLINKKVEIKSCRREEVVG